MIVFSNGLNPPYGRWASLLTPTSFGYFVWLISYSKDSSAMPYR